MKARAPQCSIWLYKPRDRKDLGGGQTASDRFRAVRQLDLTGHLSDDGFTCTRALRDPNGGSFQIMFDDKPLSIGTTVFGDSLYNLIEPMDFIEIRATGTPDDSHYPLMLRGFVSRVSNDEVMGDDGTPRRAVVIAGYGVQRVLQLLRVHYGAWGVTDADADALTAKYGIPFGKPALATYGPLTATQGGTAISMSPADFVAGVVGTLVNPYLAKVFESTPALAVLKTATPECTIVDGIVPPVQGAAAFDGRSVYEVLSDLLDVGAFNELFIDDRDADGLVLVARPLPWADAAGNPIGDGAPTYYRVDADSLISMNTARSDAGVANYYWVTRRADLINDGLRRLVGASGSSETYLDADHENANVTAFGWRFMNVQTAMTNPGASIAQPTTSQLNQRAQSEEEWLTKRRLLLRDLNRDSVTWESGSLRLKGDEGIKPGTHLMVEKGSRMFTCYVTSVSHVFGQTPGFTTTVQFERGSQWIQRATSDGLPWYEWRDERGVY